MVHWCDNQMFPALKDFPLLTRYCLQHVAVLIFCNKDNKGSCGTLMTNVFVWHELSWHAALFLRRTELCISKCSHLHGGRGMAGVRKVMEIQEVQLVNSQSVHVKSCWQSLGMKTEFRVTHSDGWQIHSSTDKQQVNIPIVQEKKSCE